MCYDPNPDWDGADSLDAAQKAAEERKSAEEADRAYTDRCCLCKQVVGARYGYRTAAGFICNHCSHEMSDDSQRKYR